jgi:hypothetical protein
MDYLFNISKSSKVVINFALLFFWISLSLVTFALLTSAFALMTGQAVVSRALIILAVSIYGLFAVITIPLQIVNQYNRIRVAKEGLYIEVYVFRYIWKFIHWNDILELKLSPKLDRWGKPQWLLKVKNLTYWHRWISWQHGSGSDPSVLINSDLIGRDKLLDLIETKLK